MNSDPFNARKGWCVKKRLSKPECVDVTHSYSRKRNFIGVLNLHRDCCIVVKVNKCSVGDLVHEQYHRCRNTDDPYYPEMEKLIFRELKRIEGMYYNLYGEGGPVEIIGLFT